MKQKELIAAFQSSPISGLKTQTDKFHKLFYEYVFNGVFTLWYTLGKVLIKYIQ